MTDDTVIELPRRHVEPVEVEGSSVSIVQKLEWLLEQAREGHVEWVSITYGTDDNITTGSWAHKAGCEWPWPRMVAGVQNVLHDLMTNGLGED